jgi:deferrochelatase/peroxidase EfeB
MDTTRALILRRRSLLLGGAVAAAAVAGAGCSRGPDDEQRASSSSPPPTGRGFHGATQTGVATPAHAHSLAAAFHVLARDRAELAEALRDLSSSVQLLVEGVYPPDRDPAMPPAHTGVLGAVSVPVEATIAVGASLFDDRYGLADRHPRELVTMPFLANDRLDDAWSHGDVLLTLAADQPDAVLHGLRQLMRATRRTLSLHWVVDGYSRPDAPGSVAGRTQNRNLLGFKDGSANLHVANDAEMETFVWIADGDDQPWAVGGTYQVVRLIRLLVERWDRTALTEQESIIGRDKVSGAPLGLDAEEADPEYGDDPTGKRIPLDAHIRLARPRDAVTERQRMLRKGFNFQKGFDGAGLLDQGLAFVSYQRQLADFLAVQQRLAGERLEEYTLPFGGGFFFVLPGAQDSDDWLGRSLLDA